MKSKNVVQSTSAWGAVLLIIPVVLQVAGVSLTEQEVGQVQAAGQSVETIALHAMSIIGTIQMILGRLNARQPLHFLPGNAFVVQQDGTKVYLSAIEKAKAPIPDDVAAKIAEVDKRA
jgi:hypothetical protein